MALAYNLPGICTPRRRYHSKTCPDPAVCSRSKQGILYVNVIKLPPNSIVFINSCFRNIINGIINTEEKQIRFLADPLLVIAAH